MDVVKVRRRIGYVIQQIGLFPNMTIADNISVVPKLLNWDKKQTDERVDELLNLVGLLPEEFKRRYPPSSQEVSSSGGAGAGAGSKSEDYASGRTVWSDRCDNPHEAAG